MLSQQRAGNISTLSPLAERSTNLFPFSSSSEERHQCFRDTESQGEIRGIVDEEVGAIAEETDACDERRPIVRDAIPIHGDLKALSCHDGLVVGG